MWIGWSDLKKILGVTFQRVVYIFSFWRHLNIGPTYLWQAHPIVGSSLSVKGHGLKLIHFGFYRHFFMSKVRCISTNTPTPPLYSSVVHSHFSSPPEYQSCTIGWLVPMISLGDGGLVSFHPLESSWHSVVCLWERMAELSSLANPSLGWSLWNVLPLGLEPQSMDSDLEIDTEFNWWWLGQGGFSSVFV